jgi:hypothetical protein
VGGNGCMGAWLAACAFPPSHVCGSASGMPMVVSSIDREKGRRKELRRLKIGNCSFGLRPIDSRCPWRIKFASLICDWRDGGHFVRGLEELQQVWLSKVGAGREGIEHKILTQPKSGRLGSRLSCAAAQLPTRSEKKPYRAGRKTTPPRSETAQLRRRKSPFAS